LNALSIKSNQHPHQIALSHLAIQLIELPRKPAAQRDTLLYNTTTNTQSQ